MKVMARFDVMLLLLVAIACLPASVHAQHVGEMVIKHGEVDDDLYLAGGQVDLYATVNGDVIVAGGQLNLEGDINADVLAAGGTITLRNVVADDARMAGGDIRVLGQIGDDLVAAAGRMHLSPGARIGGRAWLSGGEVRVDGHVVGELRASAGRVVITGEIGGDVELWAEHIVIGETAVIRGNLRYRSPREADIASGVRIDGEVVHTPVDVDFKPVVAQAAFAALIVLIGMIVTALVLYLLIPGFFQRAGQTVRGQPWLSLGVGLAIFAGTPVVIVILFSTLLGVWLALLLLAAYLATLLIGYIAGALFVADAGLKMLGKTEAGQGLRATTLAIALLVLAIIGLLPLLGSLVNWAVLLAGTGAVGRHVHALYRA